jgi:hypothetical protein
VRLLQDEGDDGVDVGDSYLAIAVHVGSAFINVRMSQYDTDNTIHIGDAHLAISVHVTLE